ncbi:MAG TPA: hypothetical protein VEL76_26195, partial [Gemmataceae bacterium]|nr:hypothetical protein [Gemmataceae bacterium]
LVLVLGAEVRRPGRFSPSTGVLLLLFALQPLWHQRALVWWLMVAPWLMVGARAAARTSKCDEHSPDALPSLRKTLLACAAVLLAVGWSIPVQWLVADAPASVQRSVADATPWRLAAVLQDPDRREPLPELAKQLQVHYPGSRFTGRIFASETLGDYLVWQLSPQQQVFIYTHVHLFSPEHWRLCTIVRSGAPGWRDVLDRYGVNLVVVEADIHPRLCQLLHAERGWRVVSAGRLFIALRTPPRPLP